MSVTMATVDVERVNRRYQTLQLRLAALQGQAKELQSQKHRLETSVSLAKARLELAPEAAEVFTYLQEKAHARAVGEFEDLLSAFVGDVVPDAGTIHLELGTERGAPALDILLDNGGDLENILEGNGGGLTNVVVTALGFSALARTANRQLMVLDEPDCWLKAQYVPNLTKVIAEVANPRTLEDGSLAPGCQTLLISHNDVSLMDEGAHLQDLRIDPDLAVFAKRMGMPIQYKGEPKDCAYVVWAPGPAGSAGAIEVRYRDDGLGDDEHNALTKGFPYVESISGARAWTPEQPGIRWIEVTNLRRHVLTRLELSPGLNVLTGDINGGKSTLYFTALRVMAYGEADDSLIRHGADSMRVRIGLEDGVVLEVVRSRKGAPKMLYRKFEHGVLAHESRQETRGGVPEFIQAALKISRVDDLDIQLRSQKQPVFLLNETPARRARLLSVGKESGLLQELIERHRLQVRRDKDLVKREELELNQVNRTLTLLAPLTSISGLTGILDGLYDEARQSTAVLTALRELTQKLSPLVGMTALATGFGPALAQVVQIPVYRATQPLASVLARIERSLSTAKLPDVASPPGAPTLKGVRPLEVLMQRLQTTMYAAQLRNIGQTPTAPVLKEVQGIVKAGTTLSSLHLALTNLAKEDKAATAEEALAKQSLQALKDELGVCPLCNHVFGDEAHEQHH